MNRLLTPAPSERHLIRLLRQRSTAAPRSPLVSCADRRATAEDLLEAGTRYARVLAGAGVRLGDRVALQCGNRLELLELLIGCSLLGATLVPINTASRGAQLAYYLRNSRAQVFVTEAAQIPHLASARIADAASIDAVGTVWSLDGCEGADPTLRLARLPLDAAAADWTEHAPHPASAAIVMYTSGTSGPSKGVMCSHAQLYWWGEYSIRNIGISGADVLYTCLPLFHINALNTFYQALLCGGRVVIGNRFSVSQFYDELCRADATVTYLLGAMVPMLLSREPDSSERRHRVRVALAPGASAAHYEAFKARTGITVLDGFGSTETNFVISTPLDAPRPGWMGKVAAGFHAKVVDADDNEAPHGTPGELVLRSDQPFAFALGYFEMPDKTVDAWRNLWFHTGDRVVRDDEGYFRFLDRMKDSIRRRGENISSYEVEQVVGDHEHIESVAAYAVPSELAEDEVMCAVVPKPGATLDLMALMRWCEPRLPYFALPRYVRIVSELPKTENGKVQKYKLRAEGVTADTWDRVAAGYTVKR